MVLIFRNPSWVTSPSRPLKAVMLGVPLMSRLMGELEAE
jgi:hypothetical protein